MDYTGSGLLHRRRNAGIANVSSLLGRDEFVCGKQEKKLVELRESGRAGRDSHIGAEGLHHRDTALTRGKYGAIRTEWDKGGKECRSKRPSTITKLQSITRAQPNTTGMQPDTMKRGNTNRRRTTRIQRAAICITPMHRAEEAAKLHVEHYGHKTKAAGSK